MFPYIGMTDVPSAEWLRARLEVFRKAGGELIPHLLHAGVMMSYKTLHGLSTKWSKAWPRTDEIESIFVDDPFVLNTLHYADYPDSEVPTPRTNENDIEEILRRCSHNLDAIQFDMVWPYPELLGIVKETNSSPRVILQVGKLALSELDHDIARLMQRLEAYEACVDDILLDMSGGTGTHMGADFLMPFVAAIRKEHPHFGITVAGGLGPDTLHLVAPIVCSYPGISIDAQGKLRTSGYSLDPIEADRADAYLRGAVEMYLATVPGGHPI